MSEKRRVITLGTLSHNRHGFYFYDYDLYEVSRRDVIRQEDHNNVKYFLIQWMKDVNWDLIHPDVYSMAQYLVERKYGDFVYPEDWNSVLQLLRKIDDTITADGWSPGVLYANMPVVENRRSIFHLIVQRTLDEAVPAGGIDTWDYNRRLRALRCLRYIKNNVGALKPPETEPEFPRMYLYNATHPITVYCTKNKHTHYGKESGMPSNYVYTYWFEDLPDNLADWDYDDAMVRIYWEYPNYRLDIYKGEAGDDHKWYYDSTLIVDIPDVYKQHGVYYLHATVWVDGRTKNLVKYTVY
jgi:hypothetical protein